jgi:hypothetical protein
MRFISRSALGALVAVFAMSVVWASAAQAAPEWFQKGKVISKNIAFTSTSGSVRFSTSSILYTCTTETSVGEIEKPNKERKVVLTLTGCTGEYPPTHQKCSIHSKGAKHEGEIVTFALMGALGKVAAVQAASEVGLLLEEETGGRVFAQLEGSCLSVSPTALTGRVAGEVTPVTKEQITDELIFAGAGGRQKIHSINVEGKEVKPRMELGVQEVTLENTDKVTFGEAVEVT